VYIYMYWWKKKYNRKEKEVGSGKKKKDAGFDIQSWWEEKVRFLSVIGSFGRHDSLIHSGSITCLCKAF